MCLFKGPGTFFVLEGELCQDGVVRSDVVALQQEFHNNLISTSTSSCEVKQDWLDRAPTAANQCDMLLENSNASISMVPDRTLLALDTLLNSSPTYDEAVTKLSKVENAPYALTILPLSAILEL